MTILDAVYTSDKVILISHCLRDKIKRCFTQIFIPVLYHGVRLTFFVNH
jgi:hypothetical protein